MQHLHKIGRRLLSGVLLGAGFGVHAVILQPIPEPKSVPIPIAREAPPIPCAQILEELQRYHQLARQHDQSLLIFLAQVGDKIKGWHAVLQPLEGTTQYLEHDTFLPLQEGADKVRQITKMAEENSEILAIAMDNLIGSLANCTLTGK